MLKIATVVLAATLSQGLIGAKETPKSSPPQPSGSLPACEAHLASLSLPGRWSCLGEADFLSPDPARGWNLRAAWIVGVMRDGESQPDQYVYVDQETHEALYRQGFGPDGSLESAIWINAL